MKLEYFHNIIQLEILSIVLIIFLVSEIGIFIYASMERKQKFKFFLEVGIVLAIGSTIYLLPIDYTKIFGIWYGIIQGGYVILIAWRISTKKAKTVKVKDRLSMLVLIIGISVIFQGCVEIRKVLGGSFLLTHNIFYAGIALMIIGITIRIIAIVQLGKFFNVVVTIEENQEIIQKGFYRYIRHPAYLGSIITLIGYSICMRSIIGIMFTILVLGIIYSYRIGIEENELEESFNLEYKEYTKKTKRLIPFIL